MKPWVLAAGATTFLAAFVITSTAQDHQPPAAPPPAAGFNTNVPTMDYTIDPDAAPNDPPTVPCEQDGSIHSRDEQGNITCTQGPPQPQQKPAAWAHPLPKPTFPCWRNLKLNCTPTEQQVIIDYNCSQFVAIGDTCGIASTPDGYRYAYNIQSPDHAIESSEAASRDEQRVCAALKARLNVTCGQATTGN